MPYRTVQTYTTPRVTYADIVKKSPLDTRDPLAFPSFRQVHARLHWTACNRGHSHSIPNYNYCPYHYYC